LADSKGQAGKRAQGNTSAGRFRGQAVPIDFMAGLFIFLVLLAYFLIQWSIYSSRYLEQTQMRNTETAAIRLAEQLVSSPGQPYNWTAAPLSAQSIGIARKQNELDPYKISTLAALPYANAKQLLGMGRNFWIRIDGNNGTGYPAIGQQPESSTMAVEVTRIAVVDGKTVKVRVQVYE
jgi:hypothetical protein